ncbi:DUF5722 domain-containing protein [Sphingobacterium sp. HJSM2_6]|uniref:DUF5722 domain-containing protein n=1 Tax=Sphingobacterium sp. HJSM2_6 TaxID=3366264 RepID=UPI003BE56494
MKKYLFSLLYIVLFLPSCKSKPVQEQVVVKETNYKIFLDVKTGNHLEATEKSGQYTIKTTGADPYLSSKPLTSKLKEANYVLTFEYTSSAKLGMQVFFTPPTTEGRSVNNIVVEQSNAWKTFSIDLGEKIKELGWGNTGHLLRIDLGNKAGTNIQIRNIGFRERNEEELKKAKEKEDFLVNDQLTNDKLKNYLTQTFNSNITEVKVGLNEVSIQGKVPNAADGYSLVELVPGTQIFNFKTLGAATAITSTNFEIKLPRTNTAEGLTYDRGLSRWAIVKGSAGNYQLQSHAHYADEVAATRNLPLEKPKTKKGLGGFNVSRGFLGDIDELGITSATVNVNLTGMMHLTDPGNSIAHQYQGKTYYFQRPSVENLDRTFKTTAEKEIVVAAIILLQGAAHSADPAVGELLEHPDHIPGENVFFTMPRMDNLASVHCYAAALDFLASRYCQEGNPYGRIHHFIMHNEVDQGVVWTNMGDGRPLYIFLDNYYHSMRLAHNIIRGYDEHAEIFASFTHSWNESATGGDYFAGFYTTKEMAEGLISYSQKEGDFQWALACHPYPEDLNEPKTWNDKRATFSLNSPLVTFKNLEVLDTWIKLPKNKYKNSIKRTLWLSENGTNSRTYSEKDLSEQAAGFAYAWKKMVQLDGIDGIQWHNWIDNRGEFGLRIGLRRFPDDADEPGGAKPVWYLYKAAGTANENTVFEPYKAVIGISNWSELDKKPVN